MSSRDDAFDPDIARSRAAGAIAGHEQAFEKFFLFRLLGLQVAYLPSGAAREAIEATRVHFPAETFLYNPHGIVHGGAISMVLDVSMGHLVNRAVGPSATLEMRTQFLEPLRAGEAICEARFLRRGRSVSFLEARLSGSDGKLTAIGAATFKTSQNFRGAAQSS